MITMLKTKNYLELYDSINLLDIFQVMELLVHVNKRLKSRPKVLLPVEPLIKQYRDPEATSIITVRG